MSNRNRKLVNWPQNTADAKYTGTKTSLGTQIKIFVLAALLGIGGVSAYVNTQDNVTVAKAVDYVEDEYDGVVPMLDVDGNVIGTIGDGNYIIIDGKIGVDDEKVSAVAISDTGESLSGQVESRYLEPIKKVSRKKIEEYDTVYSVIPEMGVNIRSSAKIEDDNKIGSIKSGEQVLGATKLLPEDNKFMWVPILYVNEEGIVEGYIRSDLLEKQTSFKMDELEESKEHEQEEVRIKMIVDTSKDSSVPLKLRSGKLLDSSNIIAEIPDGSSVYALSKDTEEGDSIDWRRVEYTDEEGNVLTGWVCNGFLQEYNETIKVVDTSRVGRIPLNVRKEPDVNSKKIAEIENGTQIKVSEANIEERQSVGNHEWVKITLTDGTEGYIAYEYLKDKEMKKVVPSSEIVKEVIEKKSLAKNGRVVGIDVAGGVSAAELKDLLTARGGAIKESTSRIVGYTNDGNAIYKDADTTDIAGKVNYVYIKLAASAYGDFGDKFTILLNDDYKEQAEVCEKLGIPYGFYYYSTARNKNEAKKEADFIKKEIDSLESRDYNLLPVALDYELSTGTGDRQYGLELSDVKAYLANLVEPEFGKTILYGGARSISPTSSERIVNIDNYNKKLQSGDCVVWLATPRKSEGYVMQDSTQTAYNAIVQQTPIYIEQTLLDAKVGGINIDIDVMDESIYDQMINKQYEEIRDISRDTENEIGG